MRNYNPMSMFDNSVPMFNTIKAKQKQYLQAILNAESIKKQLTKMWENDVQSD